MLHILSEDHVLKLVTVDKALSAGQGDTAKTVAGVRNTFTSEVNRLLAETSTNFYRHIQDSLYIDLNLEFVGYFWLLTDELLKRLEPVMTRMRKNGVALRIWDQSELLEMVPRTRLKFESGEAPTGSA